MVSLTVGVVRLNAWPRTLQSFTAGTLFGCFVLNVISAYIF